MDTASNVNPPSAMRDPQRAADINQTFQAAIDTLTEFQDILSTRAREYTDLGENYVKSNPWKALGVAAGVGLLIGLLLTRK